MNVKTAIRVFRFTLQSHSPNLFSPINHLSIALVGSSLWIHLWQAGWGDVSHGAKSMGCKHSPFCIYCSLLCPRGCSCTKGSQRQSWWITTVQSKWLQHGRSLLRASPGWCGALRGLPSSTFPPAIPLSKSHSAGHSYGTERSCAAPVGCSGKWKLLFKQAIHLTTKEGDRQSSDPA